MTVLITPAELHEALERADPPRILDVRWRLDRPDGRAEYAAGHIPGAVYVDLDRELARHGEPRDGRHPLPELEQLQLAARGWGLDDGDAVVVYDDLKSLSASRAWWLLRYAGVRDVRIIDGSLRAWTDAGYGLESGENRADPGAVILSYGHLPVIDIDAVERGGESLTLLDARAGERYRGESEPIDPRAGHIPGAHSAPTTENLDANGRFLPAAELRRRFDAFGDDPDFVAYCGSGVTAAHTLAALAIAGYEGRLYPGSWSQWSNQPERAVAVGAEPGGRLH